MTPQRASELEAMRQLVDEGESILANTGGPIREFGRLLGEDWRLKKTLSGRISNPEIDQIYETGLRAGAVGGKLLGAGGGGFMLFFVEPDRRDSLRQALKNLLCIPFAFSQRGSHVVVYDPETPYDENLVAERRAVYSQT